MTHTNQKGWCCIGCINVTAFGVWCVDASCECHTKQVSATPDNQANYKPPTPLDHQKAVSTTPEGWEKERLMQRFEISLWMRNYGIDDGDEFKAEEVEEVLQSFFDDETKKIGIAIAAAYERGKAEERERIKRMSPQCRVNLERWEMDQAQLDTTPLPDNK